MWKVLANDGLDPMGVQQLENLGHSVDTERKDLTQLTEVINDYDVLIVRSATKLRKDLIDKMDNVKLIIRAGVGLDNIDVKYAEDKGIRVHNTPTASSRSVAELAFAHIIGLYRFLPLSNRQMPVDGDQKFKALKKAYSKGRDIQGQKLGIIGLGRIGKELATLAFGAGMDVIAYDPWTEDNAVWVKIASQAVQVHIPLVTKNELLEKSDVISIHVPRADEPIIGSDEIQLCKKDVTLINTARGGCIDEDALLKGLDDGKIWGAGLDVFDNEPTPSKEILQHDRISLTPHIGASTQQAQKRIARIIVELIDKCFKDQ
ncbi:MAG: D-2-hydroxyacid dehydrogenase [Saprospiraceae bacterium]|nr:D-2-hydroxyacid dehydrogenase [Saprospiraceae bacterium]